MRFFDWTAGLAALGLWVLAALAIVLVAHLYVRWLLPPTERHP